MAAAGTERDGSRSICCDPRNGPIRYVWYQPDGEPSLLDCLRDIGREAGLNEAEQERLLGEFRARLQLAQEGRLEPLRHIKGPMEGVTNVLIYEIRLSIAYGDDQELHVRTYHAEPKNLYTPAGTRAVVGLHIHRKDIEGDDTYDEQTGEALEAGRRYTEGRPTRWGLDI